jgi:hypothetical protein
MRSLANGLVPAKGIMVAITGYDGALAAKIDDFRRSGQAEAVKHRPPTDAVHPDANEVKLRSDADRFLANEQNLFDAQIADCERVALDANEKIGQLQAMTEQVLGGDSLTTDVEAELSTDRGSLVLAVVDRIQAEVDLRGFRAQNGIASLPNYPESQIWHWAVILFLVFIETIANALFYENNQGLIGGFFIAAIVAVVNMGSATGLGSIFRFKNLGAVELKLSGWLCLPIFAILSLFCNALFASFRSVYQLLEDPTDPTQLSVGFREAWSEALGIFTFSLGFGDLTSFLLFMTGIGLSLFAFWKGYTSDDPYPGHSRRDRRLKATQVIELALRDGIKQRLKDFLILKRNIVQSLISQSSSLVAMINTRVGQAGSAERTLEANGAAIERDYHLVLDAYRQSNLAVRGVEPPAYFAKRPKIVDCLNAVRAKPTVDELERECQSVKSFQERYQDELGAKLNDLQQRMATILSSTFDTFLANVEVDAKSQVQRGVMTMPSLMDTK